MKISVTIALAIVGGMLLCGFLERERPESVERLTILFGFLGATSLFIFLSVPEKGVYLLGIGTSLLASFAWHRIRKMKRFGGGNGPKKD